MDRTYAELGFDALLALASGTALAAYMLGVVLDPASAAAVAFALVAAGVLGLVPRDGRAAAAAIGLTAVGVAGIALPRAVTSLRGVPGENVLAVTLTGSGLVLLLAFALVRATAFRRRGRRAA
jgi:hypothetical protein